MALIVSHCCLLLCDRSWNCYGDLEHVAGRGILKISAAASLFLAWSGTRLSSTGNPANATVHHLKESLRINDSCSDYMMHPDSRISKNPIFAAWIYPAEYWANLCTGVEISIRSNTWMT